MDPPPGLVSREQLLGGLAGRRVSTALFALESRTAYLAHRARHAAAPAVCDTMVEAKEQAFLSALRSRRELPRPPRIQELERFAPALGHLVPRDATVRAALAVRLAGKYAARASDVPRLRAALALDDPDVSAALADRHGLDPEDLWAATLPRRERLRWWLARAAGRLEDLPPFWTSYGLTLTQTVGAAVLALPIAMAGIGPLPGLVLIVLLGAVNVVTLAALAESFTRTGSVRWGGAYFGRVVGQYLGGAARSLLTVALLTITVVILLAYYVGFSSVLAAATGVPRAAWAAVLFGATFAAVWRGRLNATVASALLVGAVNIVILLILAALALTDFDVGRLTYSAVPLIGGRPLDPAVLGLVFGVVLLGFYGHMSVANCARVVLSRDRGGRSLVRGSIAGMLTAAVLYSVWTLAMGSAVPRDRLAGATGTALEPLAEVAGPAVLAVGSVFAVLAMGMGALHSSIGLHYQGTDLFRRGGRAGRVVAFAPLVAVFVLAELLLVTGRESFTASLSAAGTLAVPLVAGVIPVLLLASARRRGDYVPARPLRLAGKPAVGLTAYAVFVLALAAHATVVWSGPVARGSASAVLIAVVLATVHVLRGDAMRPLVTVELRRDRDLRSDRLRVVADGKPVDAQVTLHREGDGRPERLVITGSVRLPPRTRVITVDLTAARADQLRLWPHQVDASGVSLPLDAAATVAAPDHDPRGLAPDSIVPLPAASTVEVEIEPRPRPAARPPTDATGTATGDG